MTEELAGRPKSGLWPERSKERGIGPSPTSIEPHPDAQNHPQWDGLPTCDYGSKADKPCSHSALYHYGFSYLCPEHMEVAVCGEDYDEANLALYHAKRFLWKASVEGIDRLEHHIGNALRELVEEQREAEARMNAAYEKASQGDVVEPDGG